MFKKIKYNSGDGLVKIKIEDDTGKVIERWTIMFSDLYKWAELMKRKYGLSVDRDLEWIK